MRRFFRYRTASQPVEKPGLPAVIYALALLVLLLQFGFAIGEYFRNAGAALQFPYPLEYGEGPVLDQVVRLSRGENIYRSDLTTPPFTITREPPLFLAIQAPFTWVFGPAYWYGRVISILSALLAALFIGLTLYTLTRDWISSAAAGLMLLAFPYFLHWSALDRVDTLALAFSWSGLYAIVRWPEKRRGVVLAAIFFSLAIYTRQTYFLAGPLAAVAWLAQKRRLRQALALAGLTAGICVVLFLVLNAMTRGGFYFNLFTAANAAPFSWKLFASYVFQFLPNLFYLAIGTTLFLIVERFGDRTETWSLVLPYFVGATIAATFSGRITENYNAFIEAAAAFSLAAGAIIAWVGRSGWMKIAMVLILAVQVNSMVNWSRLEYVPQVMDQVAMKATFTEAARRVRESSGPLLADEYMGLAPLAGKPIYFQPVEFKALSEAGLWNEHLLIEQIEQKRFPVILLYIPVDSGQILVTRWSQAVRNAIYDNYQFVDKLGSIYTYAPQP